MAYRTGVGVDISPTHISVALLAGAADGIALLKSAVVAMPEGAVVGGNIKNPQLIAKTVKELCAHNKIPTKNIVLSLVARPFVLRIMEMPKEHGANPGQYVRDELKHCAFLAGKTLAQDFCSISPLKKGTANRILLVAADEDRIASIVTAFNRIGLAVKAVEPRLIACVRALHAGRIAKKFGTNVIIAYADDLAITFCVFRNTKVDFIRSTSIDPATLASEEGTAAIIEELGSIRQFYDLEVEDSSKNWDLVLAPGPGAPDLDNLSKSLQQLDNFNVTVCTPATIEEDTKLKGAAGKQTSLTAVGLARKLLTTDISDIRTNLLSARTDEVHNLQKYALLTTNIAAIAFLIMLFAVPLVKMRVNTVKQALAKQRSGSSQTLDTLLRGQGELDRQQKQYRDRLVGIQKLVDEYHRYDWPAMLLDLGKRTPSRIRIAALITRDDNTILLTGQAISYEDVHLFVKLLGKSTGIDSAMLVKTEMDSINSSLITYTISCKLINPKGPPAHAN